MLHSFNSISEILFFVVFISAIVILLYAFGWQIVQDARSLNTSDDIAVTSKQVNHYLVEEGYVVCNITPVKDSTNWKAFLVKNGEYLIATVFTKGAKIEGHLAS